MMVTKAIQLFEYPLQPMTISFMIKLIIFFLIYSNFINISSEHI